MRQAPRGDNLLALAKALGVSALYISTGEESSSNVTPVEMDQEDSIIKLCTGRDVDGEFRDKEL